MKTTLSATLTLLALLTAASWSSAAPPDEADRNEKGKTWSVHGMEQLLEEREASKRSYLAFLSVPAMHAGLYVLPKGGVDRQSPHDDDEVYYVLEGRAGFRVDGDETTVKAGDVIYVKAGVEHRFHTIDEDLKLLVVFSTAESE